MTLSEMIRQDRTSPVELKTDLRRKIEDDITAFFSNGGEIKQIESGTTAMGDNGRPLTTQQYWAHQTKKDKQ